MSILDEIRDRAVVDVPTAGEVFGLSRSSAYDAANRGDIETISFGRRKVVSVAWIFEKLGLPPPLANGDAPAVDGRGVDESSTVGDGEGVSSHEG